MKKLKLFILFIAVALINCERDDICAETTITTPRLLIEFYDLANTDDLKSVPRLTLYGEGLVTDPIEETDATIVFNANVSSAELPLIIGVEGESTTTSFVFEKDTNLRLDTDTTTESNLDTIEITYTSEYVYVSRACGYKSIFNNLNMTRIVDGNNWVSSIEIEETIETTIENENTVHVRIYH